MTTYNPLSFGSAAAVEREADATLGMMSQALAGVAAGRGVAVASGLAALDGRAAELTGIMHLPPDIHPTAEGHAVLAGAVMDALGDRDAPRP